eukprot:TRINITY_DN4700_c0_g2_i1.p1 TRINITY_DN4700_c0_g2~~TRINITY_DN4700_c0_g2_i1.p1  ORF type:complete len:336 (+),score=68.33 TRINITY_DN4700_c0_g2_i1:26-1009(+)
MKVAVFALLLVAVYAQVPADKLKTFGTGISAAYLTDTETTVFKYELTDSPFATMTHFWTTGGPGIDNVIYRYYIDGEKNASVEFTPSLACGVGFDDEAAPWGTQWTGKGARSGGWFHNYRIPFQKSVLITAQVPPGQPGVGYYVIVRGAENLPVVINEVQLPPTARMILQKINAWYKPLDYVYIADIPAPASGLLFQHTLSIMSGNLNFLEGCYHMYTPYEQPFPGVLLSTGTEDFFDSAYYFDAGQFHNPVAGFTHYNGTDGVQFSAYRFQFMDPIAFQGGFKLQWRNGDMVDKTTNLKCFTQSGGNVVGSPTQSLVVSYAWVYVW